jgi:alginate O-acetyltransferase complex protein AlgI
MLLRGIVALNLLSLVTFKYSGFLAENFNVALGALGTSPVAVPALLLPIGISFFTFHSISYIVDVHRRQAWHKRGLLAVWMTQVALGAFTPFIYFRF